MHIHIYNDLTGAFTGVAFCTTPTGAKRMEAFVNSHIAPGHTAYKGVVADPMSQRVDIVSGRLIDYQPRQSSLSPGCYSKRWEISPALQTVQSLREDAVAQIEALERKQLRPLRELALGMPGALERLAELNYQIEALR
jgi:hypothetical protein